MRSSTRAGIFSASELRKSESRDPNPAEKRVRHPRRSAHPHASLGFDSMSMSMSIAALAKPIVNPSRAGRRAPARRVGACVRARASSGPQWSTDKTLYGDEKLDLKEGERLQCVRTPTWISVSASTAAVRATRYATAFVSNATPTQRPSPDPRLDRARFRRRNPPRRTGRRWFRESFQSRSGRVGNPRRARGSAASIRPHRPRRLRTRYRERLLRFASHLKRD